MKTRELVSAGGVAYRKNGLSSEIVLIRTNKEGRWQLPKGLVDQGESSEQAALREVREEAGINCGIVGELETIDYWYVERHGKVPERIHKTVHFFLMQYIDGDVADHDDEVAEARWVAADDALEMLAFDTEKSVVEKAAESIT
jgi:8-oxo-dGTP pyrophosphatase MutT (NUDIX family)